MKKIITIAFGFVLVLTLPVHAAVLTLGAPKEASVAERMSVDVLIDTGGESINSAFVSVSFPSQQVRFVGYDNAQGSIPVWVREPKETQPGVVSFSGVIPGGIDRVYDPNHPQEQRLRLTRLFFIPQKKGDTSFAIVQSQILRNDGKGTELSTTNGKIALTIQESPRPQSVLANTPPQVSPDSNPPLPFIVTVLPESIFGRTPRLAVFSARDQESGIHHYEARIGSESFHEAISPFPLPYRLFSFTLTVRAVDFFGNSTDEEIVVEGESAAPIVSVALGLVLAVVFYRYVRRKRIRAHESKTPIL